MRDRTHTCETRHQTIVSSVLRRVIQAIADDGDVTCGCGETCDHAPVLEEIVLPPLRPLRVGVLSIDRDGLVAMARRRGLAFVPHAR